MKGDFQGARQDAARANDAFLTQAESEWQWKFRLLYAYILLLNGETQHANALLELGPPRKYPWLAPRYEMLEGYVLVRRQKRIEAEKLLRAASLKADQFQDFETEADIDLLLAAFLGEKDARQAQRVASAHGLGFQQAAAAVSLGMSELSRAHYGDAIPHFEQASRLAKALGATELNAIAIGNLADCFLNLGDLPRALPIRLEAVQIQKASGLLTPLRDSYVELGNMYLEQRDLAKARDYYNRALALVKKGDAPDKFAFVAGNIAQALAKADQVGQAEAYNNQGLDACSHEDRDTRAHLILNSAVIAARRGRDDHAIASYREAIRIGSTIPDVLWQAYGGLAATYSKNGKWSLANQNYEMALKVIAESQSAQSRSEYKITFLGNLIHLYQDYVELLMRENQAARALEIADSSRARVLTEDLLRRGETEREQSVARIKLTTKTGKRVFLFYWLAPKQSYVWVIARNELKSVRLADEQTIIRDVTSYSSRIQHTIGDPLAAPDLACRRLYQQLIAPVADCIPQNAEVVIVPDSVLNSLNFETLIVESPKRHYWIEDVTISVAPSLGILRNERAKSTARRLLLMGDPLVDGSDFAPLPEAALEIRRVQSHFPAGQTVALTSGKAVVGAYSAASPASFSTIHFATHVDANEQSPLDSAIILSPGPDGNRLYARDVAEIPIEAELVTISACRSAGARTLSGEGLVGFAWAFFLAGARNVVTSLWEVNDQSTAALMDDFYGGIALGKPYTAALRDAKLKMLQTQYSKPYYWAPFQLYGRTF